MRRNILTLVFALICSGLSVAQGTWSDSIQVDDDFGSVPNIYFKPNGDMFVTYNVDDGAGVDDLVYKRMDVGSQNFGPQTVISTIGTEAFILPYDGDTLYAVYQTDFSCKIYKSEDDGATWAQEKSYSNTEMADGQGRAVLVKDGNDMHLFFHFMKVSGIFGTQPFVKRASRINGVWGAEEDMNFATLIGAYQEGNRTLVFTSKGVYKSDDGVTFTLEEGGPAAEDGLGSEDYYIEDTKVSLSRAFSFGPAPGNHVKVLASVDAGDSWTSPQMHVTSEDYSINFSKVATHEDMIISTWYGRNAMFQNDKVLAKMSFDGGTTWEDTDTIIMLASDERMNGTEDYSIAAKDGKIQLVYSISNTTSGSSNVYYKEWSNEGGGSSGSTLNVSTCASNYTSPSGNYVWDSTGTYTDTIPGVLVQDSIITVNLTFSAGDSATVTQSGMDYTADTDDALYQWVDCNDFYMPIIGEIGQTFTPTGTGTYALVQTKNACTDTSECFIVSFTDIEDNEKEDKFDVKVVANDGLITINGKNIQKIEVYNALGQKVYYNSPHSASNQIDLRSNPKGIYIIFVSGMDKVISKKVLY